MTSARLCSSAVVVVVFASLQSLGGRGEGVGGEGHVSRQVQKLAGS